MTESMNRSHIEKLPTHIPGMDLVLEGGLPAGRLSLLVGSAGSGKTILGTQFLWQALAHDEPAVFVTFEEKSAKIKANVRSFGWDLQAMEDAGKLKFVELGVGAGELLAGEFDLSIVVDRIRHATQAIGAKHVFIDSIAAFFDQLGTDAPIRRMLLDLSNSLNGIGVTTLMSAERYEEYGSLSAYRAETFVSDCVMILRHLLEVEKVRRTLQVLKCRGSAHKQGEYPFTISPDGVVLMPTVGMKLTSKSTTQRISTGNPELDKMCGGGLFRDAITLVSGPTGTGKTLLSTLFANAACQAGEKAILFAFEESREQLFRNGTGWGFDLEKWEKKGLLKVVCEYPESAGPEDHLLRIKEEIAAFGPKRIVLDSLSALERVISTRSFREFVISLTNHLKQRQIAGFFTNTTATLLGGESITETHISTLTDSIILLRYVESLGRMRRGLTVIKMRGADHAKEIYEYLVTGKGLELKEPFHGIESIMTGSPRQIAMAERDALKGVLG